MYFPYLNGKYRLAKTLTYVNNLLNAYSFLGQKQGRNEFVMRLQPSEAMYMKLTVCYYSDNFVPMKH